MLRRLLADHVEDSVPAEHVNYSVRVEQAPTAGGTGVGQPLHAVYEGGCVLARDRDVGPVITTLLRHLDQHAVERPPHPVVAAVALRRDDGSLVLVSTAVRRWVAKRRRWLAAKGLELLPTPVLWIRESGEASMPPLTITPDRACLRELGVPADDIARSAAAWWPVGGWVLLSAEGAFETVGRAAALEAALSSVKHSGPNGPGGTLTALAQAMRGAAPVGARSVHRPHLVARIPELA